MMRRTKLEIICDILSSANSGARKTKIVYSANLTFTRTEKYLEILEKLQMIERKSNYWQTTEKGRDFIKNFSRIKDTLFQEVRSGSNEEFADFKLLWKDISS